MIQAAPILFSHMLNHHGNMLRNSRRRFRLYKPIRPIHVLHGSVYWQLEQWWRGFVILTCQVTLSPWADAECKKWQKTCEFLAKGETRTSPQQLSVISVLLCSEQLTSMTYWAVQMHFEHTRMRNSFCCRQFLHDMGFWLFTKLCLLKKIKLFAN